MTAYNPRKLFCGYVHGTTLENAGFNGSLPDMDFTFIRRGWVCDVYRAFSGIRNIIVIEARKKRNNRWRREWYVGTFSSIPYEEGCTYCQEYIRMQIRGIVSRKNRVAGRKLDEALLQYSYAV